MSNEIKILFVENSARDIERMQTELMKGRVNFVSHIVENESDYANALADFVPDIILSDYWLSSFNGITAYRIKQRTIPDIPFIFVSDDIGEEISIELIKNGVTDYALKDKLFTLPTKVKRAIKESKEKQEKKKTLNEKIQSEKRLARTQQVTHMGSWEWNPATNVLLLSDEACRILGFLPEQNHLLFEKWLSLVHPEDLDFILNSLKESRKTLKDASYHHRIIRSDKSVRHIYSESKFELNAEGELLGSYGIMHDITEMKGVELKLEEQNRELIFQNREKEKRAAELMVTNRELKRAEIYQKEYIEGLEEMMFMTSHKVRHAVVSILGISNHLNDTNCSSEQLSKLVGYINQSALSLDNFTRELTTCISNLEHKGKTEIGYGKYSKRAS